MRKIFLIFIVSCFIFLVYIYSNFDLPIFERGNNKVEQFKSSQLLFVGDIMMGRQVETLTDKNGEGYSFQKIRGFLSKYTVVGNLEGTIPKVHVKTPGMGFRFSFKERTARILKAENFKAVSLANNHGADYGEEGWINTVNKLKEVGIVPFGNSTRTVSTFYETNLDELSIIVYGINMVTPKWDEAGAVKVTSQIVENNEGKMVIAFMHWGNEYDLMQGRTQREFAKKLIDLGVDIVLGTHPHVTQGIEMYKEKLIFYSMGNFIFDQYFSEDVKRSYVLALEKDDDEMIFRIFPIRSEQSVPELATGKEKLKILTNIASSSDPFLQKSIVDGIIKIPYRI